MMYVDFHAGDKDYKLRLSTRNIVALEKQLGCNPLSIFRDGNKERMPTITEMVLVLHYSLIQYNHGISLNDSYDIFETYLADGHSQDEFLWVLLELYRVSGLIPQESLEKNA